MARSFNGFFTDAGSQRERTNLSVPVCFALLATCVTVLSQISPVDLTMLYGGLWVLLIVFVFRQGGKRTLLKGYALFFFVLFLGYGSFCFFASVISGEFGYLSGFFLLFSKTILVYFVGLALAVSGLRGRDFYMIIWMYIVAALLYAFWVQLNYIPSFSSWLTTEEYLFVSKNSFGQIAGMAIICAFSLPVRRKSFFVLRLFIVVYLFFMIAAAQCRTALLGCACAFLAYLIYQKKWKLILCLLFIGFLAVLFIPELRSFVVHTLMLDKYKEGGDLNAISSGRLVFWVKAVDVFVEHPFFGVGNYYVDNLYLNILVNAGLIGFVVFAGGFIARLHANMDYVRILARVNKGKSMFVRILLLASVFYLIESLMEGQPPYGPGSCAFVFWIVCGYLDELFLLDEAFQKNRICEA